MKFDFGYMALMFALPAFLPQVYKLYKDNDSSSFSSYTVILFWVAQLFWIIHGLQNSDNIIMTGALLNIMCFTYIIHKLHNNNELNLYFI